MVNFQFVLKGVSYTFVVRCRNRSLNYNKLLLFCKFAYIFVLISFSNNCPFFSYTCFVYNILFHYCPIFFNYTYKICMQLGQFREVAVVPNRISGVLSYLRLSSELFTCFLMLKSTVNAITWQI